MKIDIITLHYINHYGSLLQTYATYRMFEKMGFETEVIDYIRPNADEKKQLAAALEVRGYSPYSIKGFGFSVSKRIENWKRREFSERFLKKYVNMTRHYSNYKDLKIDPPIADIYCTGSDQTWNSEYNGGLLPAYFLDFAPAGKRKIGYAVSIGMSEFPAEEYEQTKRYIEDYYAISVREKSAKMILEQMGFSNVTHILDPTLVLTREDWTPLVSRRIIKERYIVIYKLNNIPEIEEFAENLAKDTGCKIIRMSYYLNHFRYKGKMIYSPEVEEFLSLIFYADYVLTDSFHCLAFSINFGKNFYAFYPGKFSTRLSSLLELIKTTDRVVTKVNDYSKSEINYSYVNSVLSYERKKAQRFIAESCK